MPSQVDLFPAFESVAAPPRPTRQSVAPEQQITAETFWGNLDFHAFTADEAKKNKGRLGRCTYEFESAGTLNRNRRIYPEAVFKVAVDGLRPEVDARRVLGRLDHPDPWDPDSLIVTVRDGAVLIQSVEMVSDTRVRVVADVLDNPHGRQLISVIEAGGNPGISQRGWASWRDATDDERARYGIPKGQYVAVADTLRLITYDIVSSPGFNDADKPAVTEGKGAVDMDLSNITLEQLKAGNPQIAQKLIAEGRAAASGELEQRVAAAVEAKKPELVAEANKTAEAKVAEANAQREKAIKALEAMKPVLVELGVVNEKITDAEAAGKIATLEAKVTQLTEAVADRDGKIKALTDAMEKATLETTRVRAIEQVSQTYRQSHPKLHDLIVTEVGENTGWKTAEEALAIAKRTCDLLSKVPGAGQGAAGESHEQQPFYKRFLTNPTASAEAASGGGQPSQGGSDQSLAVEQFLGMPAGAF